MEHEGATLVLVPAQVVVTCVYCCSTHVGRFFGELREESWMNRLSSSLAAYRR